jgi:hypothetical protein
MVVGVIALVVIGIFIYNAYAKPKEVAKLFPSEFQSALLACDQLAKAGDPEQYCLYYVPFDLGTALVSKMTYYDCHDLAIQAGRSDTQCTDVKYDERKCLKLASEGNIESGKSVYVSDKSCSFIAANSTDDAIVKLGTTKFTSAQLSAYPTLLKIA